MNLKYVSMEEEYRFPSLELVEEVFTEHENASEGKLVRSLVEEIRAMDSYIPALELIAVNESDEVVGYVMMSGFHLNGKYRNKLLILTPAAVKTAYQRKPISKELIELGFEKAKNLGYEAVIVEGNPANYRSRGFVTAFDHGIVPGETVHLPAIQCLMVKELKEGALENIKGTGEYTDYKALQ